MERRRAQKLTLLSGLLMIFAGCVEALLIGEMANKSMGKSSHHQMMHNGQLLMILSAVFLYVELSPKLVSAAFWLLQAGAWGNPIAYIVIAVTNCPNPLFGNSPGLVATGAENGYTKLTTFLLLGPTTCGILLGIPLIFLGVCYNDFKSKSS